MSTSVGLNYLTVQDILWANLRLTGTTNAFDFAKLEEATFYQYGYGPSTDIVKQAANFLSGFMKLAPFAGAGDDATAFVGCAAFLSLNGFELTIPSGETAAWLDRVKAGQIDAATAIAQLTQATDAHGSSPHACLEAAVQTFGSAVTAR